MHTHKEIPMRPLVSIIALCALALPALAAQQQQLLPQQSTSSLHELATTVSNATNADAGSHVAPAPTLPGGSADSYCDSTPNSQGHTALISYIGSLVLEQSSFSLSVTGHTVHAASFGMFTYGAQPTNVPFGNGVLCISPFTPGIHRMPTQALAQPTIALSMEDAAGQFALLTPGSSWYFQFWYRDPNAGGSMFNLSNGLHVVFAPTP
jgi:hypothetical protein